jgi:hypothetical protein
MQEKILMTAKRTRSQTEKFHSPSLFMPLRTQNTLTDKNICPEYAKALWIKAKNVLVREVLGALRLHWHPEQDWLFENTFICHPTSIQSLEDLRSSD